MKIDIQRFELDGDSMLIDQNGGLCQVFIGTADGPMREITSEVRRLSWDTDVPGIELKEIKGFTYGEEDRKPR